MKILGDSKRDLKRGLMLKRTGQILLLAGPLGVAVLLGLLGLVFPSLNDLGLVAALLGFVVAPSGFLLSLFLAFKLIYRGKQYSARGKAAKAEADARQPVLYFRPFVMDEVVSRLFRQALGRGVWPWFFSVEEQLADALEPIGPLVAIGKPGEQLPTPGAVREYFDATTWQKAVQRWLSIARIIILRPGISEGLWWELKEAVAAKTAERLLILMLKMKQAEYLRFSQVLGDRLGIRLPDVYEVRRWRRVSGFFEFNAAWQAHFLPLKAPFMRTEPYRPLMAAFNHTLQPLFTRFGVTWLPSSVSKFKLIAIGLSLISLILFVAWYLTS